MKSDSQIRQKHIVQIPIEYYPRFDEDPIIAWQSLGSIPQESEFPYFENRAAVSWMVDRERQNPITNDLDFDDDFTCTDDNYRFMHVDLGWKHDSCGISMCYVSDWCKVRLEEADDDVEQKTIGEDYRPYFTFDFILRIQPKDTEIIFENVRQLIYELDRRGFPILLITFDRFQSVDAMQILKRAGFIVANLSLDRTSNYPVIDNDKPEKYRKVPTGTGKFSTLAAWSCFKTAVANGRVRIPFYEPITDTEVSNYGEKVKHIDDFGNRLKEPHYITLAEKEAFGATFDPKTLKVKEPPKGSIDLLESMAGSVFNATNNVTFFEEEETDFQKKQRIARQVNQAETVFEKREAIKELDEDNDQEIAKEERYSFSEEDNNDTFDSQGFFY